MYVKYFYFVLLQCNAAVGVKAFFDMMHSGPHKLMLFGAACTHVTDPIAKASKHWHLTQVNHNQEQGTHLKNWQVNKQSYHNNETKRWLDLNENSFCFFALHLSTLSIKSILDKID